MSLKAKVEAIIYAAEEPITLEQISALLKDVVLADLATAKENAAIEQADSAAEAATTNGNALMPELAAPELIAPEEGPLMPHTSEGQTETDEETLDEDHGAESGQGISTASPLTESAPSEPAAQDTETTAADTVADNVQDRETPDSASEPQPAESASVGAPETTSRKRQPKKSEQEIAEDKAVRTRVREVLVELVTDYANEDRGMEIRQVAGGFRMATKPEHHDVVRAFAKSLKPPIRLSLAALETLAVIAYKQPITAPEIADIRGVESASVLGTLLDRKLITTAGRKQVIGRPMQYKTSKDFLLRFGLNDVNELPSMEEFSQLASEGTIEIAPAEAQQAPSLFEPTATTPKGAAPDETPAPAAGSTDTAEQETRSPLPEAQPSEALTPASETPDSQPQSEAEPSNLPEAEHPVGQ